MIYLELTNYLEHTFSETNVIESKKYYLLGDININLLPKINKYSETNSQILLIKKYLASL